jgi:hypothetical protein
MPAFLISLLGRNMASGRQLIHPLLAGNAAA